MDVLTQQKFIASQLWRLEVKDQGIDSTMLFQVSRGESVLCLSLSFWCHRQSLAFVGLQLYKSNLCLCHHMALFSLPFSVSKFLSSWIKVQPNDLITLNTSLKMYFQIRSYS